MMAPQGTRAREDARTSSDRFGGSRLAEVEIYTPTGVVAGVTARVPLGTDGPDLNEPLAIGDARWYPLDGDKPTNRGDIRLQPDEILLVVTDEPDMTVHMNLYAITIEAGPYRVSASIAMMPGFDPDRALTRPGGTFIPLRDATIELLERPDIAPAERVHIHVNRYAVERVISSLVLSFYFPGAQFATAPEAMPVA
jgi:hypothetical protein